jgi:hypothetical protein
VAALLLHQGKRRQGKGVEKGEMRTWREDVGASWVCLHGPGDADESSGDEDDEKKGGGSDRSRRERRGLAALTSLYERKKCNVTHYTPRYCFWKFSSLQQTNRDAAPHAEASGDMRTCHL